MFNALCWLLPLLAILQLRFTGVRADTTIDLCGKFDSWNSTNPSNPYSFIPNAWGDDGTGGSCLNVTPNGVAWTLTYKWTGEPTLVKQYAHMKAWPSNLPVQLKSISHLNLRGSWSTLIDGTQSANAAEQAQALHLNAVRSNVAIDMFLSPDPANSTGANPPIEVMIWPWYSPYVKPLGWAEINPNAYVAAINGMNFSLFHGYNDGGQHVFSWLAHQNLTSWDGDYAPLLSYIWQKGLLSGDLWVGQLEFGTEVLHSGAKTIFSANDYDMRLIRRGDPGDYTTTSSASMSTATNTSSTSTTRSTTPATTMASSTPTTTTKSGSSSLFGRNNVFEAFSGLMIVMTLTHIF